jgi:hypothetical protein
MQSKNIAGAKHSVAENIKMSAVSEASLAFRPWIPQEEERLRYARAVVNPAQPNYWQASDSLVIC